MKKEEIDKIGMLIENEDISGLKEFGKFLKTKDTKSFEDIGYAIMKEIEEDNDLINYFKEVSQKQIGLRELIQYCKKAENIRFFIDNRDKYELSDSFIEKMKKKFNERYYKKAELMNQRREKISKKMLIPCLILCIIIAIFGTVIILKPYFVTHIMKEAKIIEADIIEQERYLSLSDYFTTHIHIKYKYTVNGIEYTKEENTFIYGLSFINVTKNESNIEIYYYIKDPSQSYLYTNNWFYNVICISFDLLIIIGIIKVLKQYKFKKID